MAPPAWELRGGNGCKDLMSGEKGGWPGQSKATRKGLSGALAPGQSARVGSCNGQRGDVSKTRRAR